METAYKSRAILTVMGAVAALALYVWVEIGQAQVMVGRPLLFGVVATGVFFAALLAVAPRAPLPRSTVFAAVLALATALLALLVSRRYGVPEGLIEAVHPVFALLILAALPWPFFLAHVRGNWRDYGALFEQTWEIALRFGVALVLIGTVWLLLVLSDLLLSFVGLGFMDVIWDIGPAAYVITGAAGGFGVAVAGESMGAAGASLALMLLRPLLPLIVGVVAVFLIALPLRGLSGLFGAWSAGLTLMTIAAVAATLVTAVVDARDQAASRSRVLAVSARIMSGLMLILGILAAIAVAQRVGQYGWTPQRINAALAAAVSLAYGMLYGAAAMRSDWMAQIRRANVAMALGLIAMAALSLTPVMNAERISSADQMARFADGRTPADRLDILALGSWGLAGEAAVKELTELSKTAGQEALARQMAGAADGSVASPNRAALLDEVIGAMPLQPDSAAGVQRNLLEQLNDWDLDTIKAACARKTGDLAISCVMIVGDFLQYLQGDEALIAILAEDGFLQTYGVKLDADRGNWAQISMLGAADYLSGAPAIAAIRAWQSAPPVLTPAPIMQLPMGAGGVVLLP